MARPALHYGVISKSHQKPIGFTTSLNGVVVSISCRVIPFTRNDIIISVFGEYIIFILV